MQKSSHHIPYLINKLKSKTIFYSTSLFYFFIILSSIARAQNLNEQILASTVLITSTHNGIEKAASGFVIFKETNKITHQGSHFLITNKHVFSNIVGPFKIRFYRNDFTNSNTKMELTIYIKDKMGNYLPKMRFNLNKEDLVAIDITQDYIDNQIQGQSLPYEFLATKDTLKKYNISVGDEIYMVGYPDAIYDNRNYSPIFRYGIIATLPSQDYNFDRRLQEKYNFPKSIPGFLIDANVFPGSSGSLIILKEQIGKAYNGSINMGSMAPFILGIVQKSIPIEDETPNNMQRMGLGVVYSAETIKNTIDYGIRLTDQ